MQGVSLSCNNGCQETPHHFLLECTKYSKARANLIKNIKAEITKLPNNQKLIDTETLSDMQSALMGLNQHSLLRLILGFQSGDRQLDRKIDKAVLYFLTMATKIRKYYLQQALLVN